MKKMLIMAPAFLAIGLLLGWLIFRPSSNTGKDPSASRSERKIAYYKDPMHPWFTSDRPGKAPDCGMDLVPVYEGESDVKGIRIDPVVIQNIGVKTEEVQQRTLTRTIRTVGKVTYDETKLYNVNTKIMGWVENLYVDYTGKVVRKGDHLLDIYSPELVNTQEEYLLALRYRDQLLESNVEEARKGADALIQSAKRRLLYWDIPPQDIDAIEEAGVPNRVMTIYSPADGIVLEKMVVDGQNIMAGMTLYKIADLSNVWVLADVYQFELPWVKLNQPVEVELSYLPGKVFNGRVTYIYPFLSEETKTVKVRIEVPNPPDEIVLKPDMYATVRIKSPQVTKAIAVPEQAVIRSGERNIVVVALGGGYFDPREVKLGVTADGFVQILEGIKEGEKIVTSSQFLIDSESNLKAAIGLMSGHAGHGTSKPKDEQRPAEESRKGLKEKPPSKIQQGKQGEDQIREPSKGEHEKHEIEQVAPKRKADRKARSPKSAVPKAVVDPVCGMKITPDEQRASTYKGTTYYFCSDEDLEKFEKNPEGYTAPAPQG